MIRINLYLLLPIWEMVMCQNIYIFVSTYIYIYICYFDSNIYVSTQNKRGVTFYLFAHFVDIYISWH